VATWQLCTHGLASLLCVGHSMVVRWSDKEGLQVLHCIMLNYIAIFGSCSCSYEGTAMTSLSLLTWWGVALHNCFEQSAASVMPVVSHRQTVSPKSRTANKQNTTYPDCASTNCEQTDNQKPDRVNIQIAVLTIDACHTQQKCFEHLQIKTCMYGLMAK